MPLRIRCPHCFRVLVAADETAGQTKLCPACKQTFNVPLLPREVHESPPEPTGPKCPRCGREAGPAATYCPKCHTDLTTGKRLPLARRLRLRTWHFWVAVGLAGAAGVVAILIGIQVYMIAARPAPTPFRPAVPREVPAAELAQHLLQARDPAAREAVLRDLAGVEARVAPAVATALAESIAAPPDDPQSRWNQVAAIDLLARQGRANPSDLPRWLGLLARCQQEAPLYEAALRARALLGDDAVTAELGDLWLDQLRRWFLLGRVIHAGRLEEQAGARLIQQQTSRAVARCADGLRVLGQTPGSTALDHLAQAYWQSWDWLGQGRGDRLADELFGLAKPAEQTLEFRPEDVRQPRDVMKAIAARAAPAARAAAGLVLEQRGPQYKTLCRTIGDSLGPLLAQCDPADQQRLTWAIERLRGKLFGLTARTDPLDISAEEIAAASQWAGAATQSASAGPYPQAPQLVCRTVPVARLLERDLLAQMQQGWKQARRALDRWQAADLGVTPQIRDLIHPGQRRPDYPALAAAFVIIAQGGDESLRPQLELWREATDQPAWVQALAYTVLGSLDAWQGRWTSGWPAGLNLGDTHLLDAGTPGWDTFGRVLVAGGPDMLKRLGAAPAGLPPDVAAKLLDAAKTAAARAAPE